MGGTARFEGHIDDRLTKTDAVIGAVVHRLDDVGAFTGEDFAEVQQGAGTILQIDSDTEQAAILHKAALDDLRVAAMTSMLPPTDQDLLNCGDGGELKSLPATTAARAAAPAPSASRFLLFQEHENGAWRSPRHLR